MNELEEYIKTYLVSANVARNIPRDSELWRKSKCYWRDGAGGLNKRHSDTPMEYVYAPAPSAEELIAELESRGLTVKVSMLNQDEFLVVTYRLDEDGIIQDKSEYPHGYLLYALAAAVCGLSDRDDLYLRGLGWELISGKDAKARWAKNMSDARGHQINCTITREASGMFTAEVSGSLPSHGHKETSAQAILEAIDGSIQKFLRVSCPGGVR